VAGIDQALATKTKALSPPRVQLLQQDRATIANAVERMRAAPTLDCTAMDDIMQELERAGQQYERGFTETGKQPPGSFGGLGNLARGWRSLADSAPARDAEFSKFVDRATPALRKTENRANFVPGPLRNPAGRQACQGLGVHPRQSRRALPRRFSTRGPQRPPLLLPGVLTLQPPHRAAAPSSSAWDALHLPPFLLGEPMHLLHVGFVVRGSLFEQRVPGSLLEVLPLEHGLAAAS
jgi:hypothetical protein